MTAARPLQRHELEHRAEAAAARLPGLLVAAQRIAANVNLGAHGRRQPGLGESFWQFRSYGPDDSPHAVDWRQSAKSDEIYIKEREWAASQTVALWCDFSSSMNFRSRRDLPTKGERAAVLLLALGILLVEGGERVLRLSAAGSPVAAATTGRLALMQIAEQLTREEHAGAVNTLPAFNVKLPRYGATVLIGDFLQPLAVIAKSLEAFRERHQRVHVVQVLDPAEETLPFNGRVRFEGLEDEGAMVVDRAEDARAAYVEKLAAHRGAVKGLTSSRGWSFTTHRTDAPPYLTLVALHRVIGERPR
jgi:uncharacterized protein (DUF58 family)